MSSPRQKMVVVAPSQPNELEQKKKRQTLERARANHLSKQLQMRLQYAKLKVEHGWQRQNLNEVENLYFHHSHQRNMRQQQTPFATATYPHGTPVPIETHGPAPVPDRTVVPLSLVNNASSSGSSVSPPSQSPSEPALNADARPSSQSHPSIQTAAPIAPAPSAASRPPSALDFSDPNILARLAQLQAQVQLPSQSQPLSQSQTVSHISSTTTPSTSTSQLIPVPVSTPVPIPGTGTFLPHTQLPQSPLSHPQPTFLLGALTPGSVPLYPIPASAPHNLAMSQLPISVSVPASGPMVPIPTTSIPAPIAPSALTYDSFWSTHASSAGPTRALYRTHTGFTTTATPGGNVAMLTPGGNAAIMTAEGVYVGGANK